MRQAALQGGFLSRTPVVKPDIANLDIYIANRSALVDYATPLVGCRAGAEDVVQEAYLRFERVSNPVAQGSVARPLNYLFRIVRNLAIDWTRRRSNVQSVDPEVFDHVACAKPTPEDETLHRDRLRVVLAALQELPDRTRLAFLMHRVDGVPLQEVADRLSISIGLAHHLVHVALTHCAERLDEQPSGRERHRDGRARR